MGKLFSIALLLASAGYAAAQDRSGSADSAISAYRRQYGLSAVKADAKLTHLAQQQANAMARTGNFDHSAGGAFSARIASYSPAAAWENIAAGTPDFPTTLTLWKRSPGHNANLLKSGATRIGIASARSSQGRFKIYWALILAQPDSGRGSAGRLVAAGRTEQVRRQPRTQPATMPAWLKKIIGR